jgi:DNA repair protein RadD
MLFNQLPKKELQHLIGQDVLDRLENIIPVISEDNIDENEIYRKETLVKIFSSFSNSTLFKNKKLFKNILNTTSEEDINKICASTSINIINKNFQDKVNAIVAQGWTDTDFCRRLLGAVGLPDTFLPVEVEKFISQELCEAPQAAYKTLKDYQYGVYTQSIKQVGIPSSRFIIQMPTGSGKTRTSMEIIVEVLKQQNEGSVVFWLAHSEELCEQAVQAFKEVWQHVGNKNVKVLKVWSEGRLEYAFNESAFVVGGFQKLYSILSKNEIGFNELKRRIKLLVIDEAHKVLAPTYKKVTKALIGEGTRVIGLTATPGRNMDNFEENAALSEFFFNKNITIETGKAPVIKYLRDRKVLSKAKFDPLITNIKYELSAQQKKHLETFYDFPDGLLKTIGSDDVRNVEIIKRLQKELDSGDKQIIFFSCSVEQSKFICSLLIYLGYQAAHVDGSTEKPMRHKLINDFKDGKLKVICNFGVLSTGFDAPKTDVVFIARPTRSIVLYSQMIGRGLRGSAIGGTENCTIITVKDNIVGLPNEEEIFSYFDEYFE